MFALFFVLALALAACGPRGDTNPGSTPVSYAKGDTLVVIGTLVDTRCFALDKSNIGDDHIRPEGHVPACGTACAMQGIPVAVLEGGVPTGKPWILVSYPSQIFAEYIASTVRVLGQFGSDGILVPINVDIETDDGWAQVF